MSELAIQNIIYIVKILVIFGAVLTAVPFMVMLERILIARIQHRVGPNRVGLDFIPGLGFLKNKFIIGGILQAIVDGAKLFLKEDIKPLVVDRTLHTLAPLLTLVPAILILAIVPFGPIIDLWIGESHFPVLAGITSFPIDVLFYFAVTSVAVYGLILAGYASNSKYSLLGGVRSSAQMISYELTLALSLAGVLLIAGTLSLRDLVAVQAPGVWEWNLWRQPLGAGLFLLAGMAELNRLPFDLPEGEGELGAGFHTEYSSMKFAMFFMAEYMNMFTFSAIFTTIFLGGFHGLFPLPEAVYVTINQPVGLLGFEIAGIGSLLLGLFWFSVKVFLMLCFFVLVRGTLPRFRYDQLMDLGWKVLFPAAVLNMVVTAVVVALVAGPLVADEPLPGRLTLALLAAGIVQIVIIDMILSARKKRLLRYAH